MAALGVNFDFSGAGGGEQGMSGGVIMGWVGLSAPYDAMSK